MTSRGWWLVAGVAGMLAAIILSSCSSIERTVVAPPMIEGASFAGNKACYECHTNYTRQFASSAHGRVHVPEARMKDQTGCESCHGPGSRHIASGGNRSFIVNPGRDSQSCLTCHVQVHAEINLPHHHPIAQGRMNCVQCHDPHGSDIMKASKSGLAMSRLNESCASCHREQSKPRVYEHDAMREGCTTCHSPHGSINDKMLIERDSNLCLKCHAQVPGPSGDVVIGKVNHSALGFASRGTCWSAGCHPNVHGSNVSPKFHY